jgi:hypothetical protein
MGIDRLSRSRMPGTGNTVPVTVANPAAGTNFTLTVPAGKVWRLLTLAFSLTTSAVVGNRIVRMIIRDAAGNLVFQASTHGTQPATQTVVNNTVPYLQMLAANGQDSLVGVPDIPLLPGMSINTNVGGMDPGDTITNIFGLVEEWNLSED